MLITEWNTQTAIEVRAEESYQKAKAEFEAKIYEIASERDNVVSERDNIANERDRLAAENAALRLRLSEN